VVAKRKGNWGISSLIGTLGGREGRNKAKYLPEKSLIGMAENEDG
jgi:hypothetical protein